MLSGVGSNNGGCFASVVDDLFDVLIFVDVDYCIKVIKEHIIVYFVLYLFRIAGIG